MIKELQIELNQFIETCEDELLKVEAISILACKSWWCDALQTGNNSFHFVRTEQIFIDYRANRAGLLTPTI